MSRISYRLFTRAFATIEKAPALSNELNHSESHAVSKSITKIQNESFAESIYERTVANIEAGKAHFRVGGKQSYFPKARVILMKPGARHTPYQAKFIVPKSFNKLDLRDYLYHVYGLRALNVTSQLSAGTIVKFGAWRYRKNQIKTMIVDMEEPFIWPNEETIDPAVSRFKDFENDLNQYQTSKNEAFGSDIAKPTKFFEGIYNLDDRVVKHSVESFVPKRISRRLKNKKVAAEIAMGKAEDLKMAERLIDN